VLLAVMSFRKCSGHDHDMIQDSSSTQGVYTMLLIDMDRVGVCYLRPIVT